LAIVAREVELEGLAMADGNCCLCSRPCGVCRVFENINWAGGFLVLLMALAGISCSRVAQEKPKDAEMAAKRALPVQLARVASQSYRRTVVSVGSLFPDEEVTVSSEVEGRVEQVLVDVGDRVARGQPLVKIATDELTLSLAQARAALQQVRARLGLSGQQDDLRDVRDSAEVKKAQADLVDAEQKYQRARSLLDRRLVAREVFEETESRYKAAQAAYDLAVQTVENLRAQMTQYRASMEMAQKKLNDCTIRSPFGGEVEERRVAVGQYLIVQSPVMVIVSMDPLRARLKIPEKMAAWIQVGQEVSVSVEAYPNRTFTGRISRLNPSVDQQTRTFEAEALIANNDGKLKPGFFVKASIPSALVDKVLFVPERAVQYSYGVYKVFVADGSNLREQEVHVGEHTDQQLEIIDGLREGDEVAIPLKGIELRDQAPFEVVP
jgi:membrane fusion protein (multidrug efflux system)